MTIQEYTERMGYLGFPSDEEYTKANLAYMMAGNMDKDEFCKDYRKHKDSVIIATLAEAANSREIAYRDKETKERQTAHALLREADAIRAAGHDEEADQIDKIAASLIGRKDCITWKLNKGFALSDTDNEYITDNLR